MYCSFTQPVHIDGAFALTMCLGYTDAYKKNNSSTRPMHKRPVFEIGDDPATAATCSVCGGALTKHVAVRLGRSGLRTCGSCGSWTYVPRGSASHQAAIHDNAQYFEHPYFKLRRGVTPAQHRRCRDVFARLATHLEIGSLRGERLLDIGCDTGMFLKAAQEQFGIIPVGVDVAEQAVQAARHQGVETYQASLEQAPAELSGFALATAIDLIEHVSDPGAFLREIRLRLRPGGVVYLETPNIRSTVYRFGQLVFSLTGGRPAALLERLFPPQHIQYFTPESLRRLALDSGFEVLRLGNRPLPSSDIAASTAAIGAIGALQVCDHLFSTGILIYAVLRRPGRTSTDGGHV